MSGAVNEGMGKIAPLAIALVLTGLIAGVSFAIVSSRDRGTNGASGTVEPPDPNALAPEPGWEGVAIPEFELVDQQGQTVRESLLDGKISVVDFIFTHCPAQCPAMTGQIWDVSNKLKGTGVQFVSFSIDPEGDRPERLAAYARNYDIPNWTLLTEADLPAQHVARSILSDEIGFMVRDQEEDPIPGPGGRDMFNILHPTKIFLIGPNREILGTYEYAIQDQVDMLVDRARRAERAVR